MLRILPNGFRCIVPSSPLCTICHASRPIQFRERHCVPYATMRFLASSPSKHHCVANATHLSQCVRASPSKRPFRASLRSICHASPPMRACVSFQNSTCVPFATHHAQCVVVHRPLPSVTLCTICHSSRPVQFLSSPGVANATHSPQMRACISFQDSTCVPYATITPKAFACIVPFRSSPCVPYAPHQAQCKSVHHPDKHMPRIMPNACVRLLPRVILCTICHASHPLHFRAAFPSEHHSVPYATHHPQCVRASPSKTQFGYHIPRIMPNAFLGSVPFRASPCTPYATHHAQHNLVHRFAWQMPCDTSNVSVRLMALPCTTCHAPRPMQFRESPCIPNATHHPQYVAVRRPVPSIIVYHLPRSNTNACVHFLPRLNLCTIVCAIFHASRPMRFRASSPSEHHLVYHMPRITHSALP